MWLITNLANAALLSQAQKAIASESAKQFAVNRRADDRHPRRRKNQHRAGQPGASLNKKDQLSTSIPCPCRQARNSEPRNQHPAPVTGAAAPVPAHAGGSESLKDDQDISHHQHLRPATSPNSSTTSATNKSKLKLQQEQRYANVIGSTITHRSSNKRSCFPAAIAQAAERKIVNRASTGRLRDDAAGPRLSQQPTQATAATSASTFRRNELPRHPIDHRPDADPGSATSPSASSPDALIQTAR